jgi:hypothetical protein
MHETVDFIASDHAWPNTCPYDGARTDLVEAHQHHTKEQCPVCEQIFYFWEK